jgi:rubrerythrin
MSTFRGKLDALYNFPCIQVKEKYMAKHTVGELKTTDKNKMYEYRSSKCGFQLPAPEELGKCPKSLP